MAVGEDSGGVGLVEGEPGIGNLSAGDEEAHGIGRGEDDVVCF